MNARIESIKESNLSTKESSQAKYDEVLANIADKVEIFICDWLENIDDYERKSASLNSTWAEKMLEHIRTSKFEEAYQSLCIIVEKNNLSDILFLSLALTTFRLNYLPAAEKYAAQAVKLQETLNTEKNIELIAEYSSALRNKIDYDETSKIVVNDRFVNMYPTESQISELNSVDKYIMEGLTPSKPFIKKSDNIITIGSCFTGNISTFLRHNGFKVPILNDEYNGNVPTASFSDEVFNTFILRQLFTLLFDNDNEKNDEYEFVNQHNQKMSLSIERTRQAFKKSNVFIITLGISEVWYNKKTGEVYKTAQSVGDYDPNIHDFRVTTVKENFDNLLYVIQLIRKHVKDSSIIFTLSPVPLKATFRDVSCTVANTVSKSILRVALEDVLSKFSNDENIYYFPAYELITDFLPKPFETDRRYIGGDTVNFVMTLFANHYLLHSQELA